jgi:hypothetical protein
MPAIQPINDWFGLEPKYVPPKQVYTREQRAKAKQEVCEPRNEHDIELGPDEEWFRHNNWREKRKVVRSALASADTSASALFNFDNCGAGCQVEFSKEQNRYRIVGSYCHSRHCQPCMKAKSALITNNLRKKMQGMKQGTYHFITLTLAHDKTRTPRQQIQRLYECYKRLRQTDEWKYGQLNADRIYKASKQGVKHSEAIKHVSLKGQRGGAATLEIKHTEAGHRKAKDGSTYWYEGGWHPHLHIISEGSMITDHRLKDLWFQITTDSWECDCRRISADKDVAYYVGKYVTKGTNDAVWQDPTRASEFVKAVKGVRMCATFGEWRGYKLLQREPEKKGEWTHIASLASICRRARTGDEWAIEILMTSLEPMQYDPHRKRTPKPK